MSTHQGSLNEKLGTMMIGQVKMIPARNRDHAINLQKRITTKTRYPKAMRGWEFSTELWVARPMDNALAEPILYLYVRRIS